ncbi:MAG: isochorismatase [Bdellovibrionaceae bacterium]|nr:isochorismatase [Pseudobdellovibrionaceae bacterium]|tara:strand:+ start:6712 stop:7296 length:585 start_codon:yes stop_codon:yes gene_type:complete
MKNKALILIGFQNDYFSKDGILHDVIESEASSVLTHTLNLIDSLVETNTLMISTPIVFTENYEELESPVGILKMIKDSQAFKKGNGSEIIPEILEYGDRIQNVPGKRGLNAFSNTALDEILKKGDVQEVILAGVVTSICIDSTARSAHEKGYRVVVLKDCTGARTPFEQDFYFENIFPLYANVMNSEELIKNLK